MIRTVSILFLLFLVLHAQQIVVRSMGECPNVDELSRTSWNSPLIFRCERRFLVAKVTIPYGCDVGHTIIFNGQTYEDRRDEVSIEKICKVTEDSISYDVKACGFYVGGESAKMLPGSSATVGGKHCECRHMGLQIQAVCRN